MKLATYKGREDLMKRLLITPLFKRFKKSVFFLLLHQNTSPVYDAEDKKRTKRSY
tara:strand:- start:45 stop:209 length:165 start_codon:yes stop_codon:yes gene_type:complete